MWVLEQYQPYAVGRHLAGARPCPALRQRRADADGRVRRFAHKPDEPVSDVVTTEVFVFDGTPLLETVDQLASPAGEEQLEDFGDELIPHLVERGELREHRFSDSWRDVGTLGATGPPTSTCSATTRS